MRAVLLTLLLLSSVAVSASVSEEFTLGSVDSGVSIVHDESSRTIIASAGAGMFKIAYGSAMDAGSITMTSVVPVSKGHAVHVDVQGNLDAHNHLFEDHVVVHSIEGAIEYLDADDDGLLGINSSLAHKSRLDPETLTETAVALVDYSTLDWSAEVHSDAFDDNHTVATVRLISVDVPLLDANGSLIKHLPLIEYRFVWTIEMTIDGEMALPVYRLEVDDASQVVSAWRENDVNTPAHRITTQWKYDQIIEGWDSTTSEEVTRLHVLTQTIHAVEIDEATQKWMTYHNITTLPTMQPVAQLLQDDAHSPATPNSGLHRSFECAAPSQLRGCLGPNQMMDEILTPVKLQGSIIRFSPWPTDVNIFTDLRWASNVTVDDGEYDVLSQVDRTRNVTSGDLVPLTITSVNGWVFGTGLNYPLGDHSHHSSEMVGDGVQYASYTVDVVASNAIGPVAATIGPLMGVGFLAFVLFAATIARNPTPVSSSQTTSTIHLASSRESSKDVEE